MSIAIIGVFWWIALQAGIVWWFHCATYNWEDDSSEFKFERRS